MFWRSNRQYQIPVDMHSHLIPGVDDGSESIDESLSLMEKFVSLGYKKLITTPHISETYYTNSVTHLREKFSRLEEAAAVQFPQLELILGAEYMVDEMLLKTLKSNQELLSWSSFVLIETSFYNLPMIFDEVLFEIQQRGLTPVYAHPERYPYFLNKWENLESLRLRGVKLQINSGSLVGYYGDEPKMMAKQLIKRGMVDFIGSDVHGQSHIKALEKCLQLSLLKNARNLTLGNNIL